MDSPVKRTDMSVCSSTSHRSAHGGKTIYLRKEFHERIQKIVQTIGNNEMSIFSYVDNVLEQHFSTYQDEITKEYRKRSTELF